MRFWIALASVGHTQITPYPVAPVGNAAGTTAGTPITQFPANAEQRQPLARDVIPGHLFACRCFCGTRDYNPPSGAAYGMDHYGQESSSYKYVFNPEPIYTASVQRFGETIRNPKIMRTVRDPVSGRLREFFSVVAAFRSADLSVTEAKLFKSYLDGNPPQGKLILTLISELLQRSVGALQPQSPEPSVGSPTGDPITPVLNSAAVEGGVEALTKSIFEIASLGATTTEQAGGLRGHRATPAQQILSGDFSLAFDQAGSPVGDGSAASVPVTPSAGSQVRFISVTADTLKTPFAARAQCVKICRDEVLSTPSVARRFAGHLDYAILKRGDMQPIGEYVTPERFEWGLPYVEIPSVQNLPRDAQWELKMKQRFEKPYHLAANFDPKTGFTKAVVLPDGKSSVQPDGLCSQLYNSLNDFVSKTDDGMGGYTGGYAAPQEVQLEYRDLDLSDWYRPHDLDPSRNIAQIRHLPYHSSPLDQSPAVPDSTKPEPLQHSDSRQRLSSQDLTLDLPEESINAEN